MQSINIDYSLKQFRFQSGSQVVFFSSYSEEYDLAHVRFCIFHVNARDNILHADDVLESFWCVCGKGTLVICVSFIYSLSWICG